MSNIYHELAIYKRLVIAAEHARQAMSEATDHKGHDEALGRIYLAIEQLEREQAAKIRVMSDCEKGAGDE